MHWDHNKLDSLEERNGFRLRGQAMTRLEVFSDAAFAFALTMLMVSVGTIPNSYSALVDALKSVPAFALSFAQIAVFWVVHRVWSQRYGLETTPAILLTLLMVFIVLVYVYPLRLIFSSFCWFISGGWLPSEFIISGPAELAGLFAVYGIGYAALSLVIALLYIHAIRLGQPLLLNDIEIIKTKESIAQWCSHAVVGFSSALFALTMPPWLAAYAGFLLFGSFITATAFSIYYAKKLKYIQQ